MKYELLTGLLQEAYTLLAELATVEPDSLETVLWGRKNKKDRCYFCKASIDYEWGDFDYLNDSIENVAWVIKVQHAPDCLITRIQSWLDRAGDKELP